MHLSVRSGYAHSARGIRRRHLGFALCAKRAPDRCPESFRGVPGFALRLAGRAHLIEKSRIRHESAAERSLDRQTGAFGGSAADALSPHGGPTNPDYAVHARVAWLSASTSSGVSEKARAPALVLAWLPSLAPGIGSTTGFSISHRKAT